MIKNYEERFLVLVVECARLGKKNIPLMPIAEALGANVARRPTQTQAKKINCR